MAETHQSKYAQKRNLGRQMYGPGCCAHRISIEQVTANRRRVHVGRKHGLDELQEPEHVSPQT